MGTQAGLAMEKGCKIVKEKEDGSHYMCDCRPFDVALQKHTRSIVYPLPSSFPLPLHTPRRGWFAK